MPVGQYAPHEHHLVASLLPDPHSLPAKELVTAVSQERVSSQKEREARGDPALFRIDRMALEISFVVTKSAGGKGGFNLSVITASAGAKYESQEIHKVSLRFGVESGEKNGATPKPGLLPR